MIIIEGKDWEKVKEIICDVRLSDAQIEKLGLNILDCGTVTKIEKALKSNIIENLEKELFGLIERLCDEENS